MNNYNKRLDEILDNMLSQQVLVNKIGQKPFDEAVEAITSLIKELVEEAKPKTMPSNLSPENYERCERVVNQYHQNLLKALEEV